MSRAGKTGYSDGVITPMNAEDLIQKLSRLNTETTMTDVANIFGKEPHMIIEANSDIWEYFIGDIGIGLSGINLFGGVLYQAIVAYDDASIEIHLQSAGETSHNDCIISPMDDGIIVPMGAEDLIQKLSRLNTETTMSDVANIFGKEPHMDVAANSNSWNYFIGNITIGLMGIDLFDGVLYQATVAYGDASIEIHLQSYGEKTK